MFCTTLKFLWKDVASPLSLSTNKTKSMNTALKHVSNKKENGVACFSIFNTKHVPSSTKQSKKPKYRGTIETFGLIVNFPHTSVFFFGHGAFFLSLYVNFTLF